MIFASPFDSPSSTIAIAEEILISNAQLIEANLLAVLGEIRVQPDVGKHFPADLQNYSDQIEQLREWIEDAGEFGIAYESIVSMLEAFPFKLSGPSAVKLLEIGLLLQFKTERVEDKQFDSRR